ncbi:protein LURP-one-related 10-like [Juglans regia]|uniref:Protein LURP-one-related 10-like n=2 Tax=Juglans regia TaxID=51240 RepID=A0A2I4EJ38_JUGRE|nr:protein LURP-one-related 10-like [Juglans regia]
MAQPIPAPAPTVAQFANPLPVICTQYCAPYAVDLAVVKKVMTISGGNFVVTDNNDNVIFNVKGNLMTLHDARVLLDAAGNPIVTLREKRMTAHHRWNVYRGESKEPSDLIFTVKRSSTIQRRAKLHVFLANNTNEEVCDFMVEGSWAEKSCVVYTGDRTNIIAQMCKKTTVRSVLVGKDNYSVTVHPNVDYAFIVALIVILDDMNHITDMDGLFFNLAMSKAELPSSVNVPGK